ncbi:MAG: hypothetical protein ACFB51_22460 [Anaerolineae bacterium]
MMKRIPKFVDVLFLLALAIVATGPNYIGTDIPGGTDVENAFYPWLAFAHDQLAQGHFPLWDPYGFLGNPFVTNPQTALFSPLTWPSLLLGPRWGLAMHGTLTLWLAAIGMMLWVRCMGIPGDTLSDDRRIGSLLAGIAFAFGLVITIRWWAGHTTVLGTLIWTPWLLAATSWSLHQQRRWAAYVVSGIPLALAFVGGHPTSAVYVLLPWGLWVLHLAFLHRDWRCAIEQMLVAGTVGVVIAAVQLVPVAEIFPNAWSNPQKIIDGDFKWSMQPLFLVTALAPNYFGLSPETYWGLPNLREMSFSIGPLGLFGWTLAVVHWKQHGRYLLGITVLGVLIAMGHYVGLYPFLYYNVPYFDIVRVPSRAAFLIALASAAGFGEAIANRDTIRPAHLNISLALIGLVALAGLIGLLDHANDLSNQQVSAIVAGLTVGTVLALTMRILLARWKSIGWIAPASLSVLLLGSSGGVSLPLLHTSFSPERSSLLLELDSPVPRVATIARSTLYNRPSRSGIINTTGYSPLQIQTYRDLISLSGNWQPEEAEMLFSLVSMDYLLTPSSLAWELVDEDGPLHLYRVPDPLPVARVVHQIEVGVDDPRGRVLDEDFNPATTAIVSEVCPIEEAEPAAGEILVQEPGMWAIEVETDAPGVLVLAETAYPGWRVWVNGERADPLTAYGALKAVCVPAGASTVRWAYRPMSVYVGAAVSVVGCVLAGISVVRLVRDERRASTAS